ncbi:MAG TPA: EVE domain-containing protein [Kribbellaceae bacterium]
MTRYWLGVVSREHVRRGVGLGIAQVNHGRRGPLQRMRPGDGIVYYSPRERIREGAPVQAFTAIGTVDDREPWQADEGSFQPWRRAVSYRGDAREAPVVELRDRLELTATPNWGVLLRRGLLELSEHDYRVISQAMVG